ncbi:TPA: hypothetical protein ACH3X3_003430 [Trebouxia sp. C0006]
MGVDGTVLSCPFPRPLRPSPPVVIGIQALGMDMAQTTCPRPHGPNHMAQTTWPRFLNSSLVSFFSKVQQSKLTEEVFKNLQKLDNAALHQILSTYHGMQLQLAH